MATMTEEEIKEYENKTLQEKLDRICLIDDEAERFNVALRILHVFDIGKYTYYIKNRGK